MMDAVLPDRRPRDSLYRLSMPIAAPQLPQSPTVLHHVSRNRFPRNRSNHCVRHTTIPSTSIVICSALWMAGPPLERTSQEPERCGCREGIQFHVPVFCPFLLATLSVLSIRVSYRTFAVKYMQYMV